MILIGGVDDTTLNLKHSCCRISNIGLTMSDMPSGTFDLTDACRQRGMVAFGPRGNPISEFGPPDVNKYRMLYARY